MSHLNETPKGERLQIVFLGRRNVGKSSLINAFTSQELSIVSPVAGTTTDPVQKSMELLHLGPVTVVDTPGLDDEGELGLQRVEKTRQMLKKADLAVVVLDATAPLCSLEEALMKTLTEEKIPFVTVYNKADLLESVPAAQGGSIYLSAREGTNLHALREMVASLKPQKEERKLVRDLVSPGDTVVLVCPIDASAPKGRLILPQQMVLRDLLDAGVTALVCRDTELSQTLAILKAPPKLVITDSQVFGKVMKIVPETVGLTSFSILMARYKGSLQQSVLGAKAAERLRDGDKVLIAEGCTHHRQCQDIGTVKIPRYLEERYGVKPQFTFTSGGTFPEDLGEFRLVIHCGGCMLTEKDVQTRMEACKKQGVPVTNYGVFLANVNGILDRSLAPLPGHASFVENQSNL